MPAARKGDVKAKIGAEGARTVPPREHGGNCDIKDLSRGSKIYFPVYVPGGGLSMGDLHFSQGDGEITFCGAIEMAGWLHLKVDIIKDGVAKYGIKNPIFKPSPITPNYKDYLIFEGISVDEAGKQHYLDVHIAYRQACLNAIEYLKKFGYSGAQAYAILGVAPVQGHISGVVDIPNACATLYLPTEIFDFDIMPSSAGPDQTYQGRCRRGALAGQVIPARRDAGRRWFCRPASAAANMVEVDLALREKKCRSTNISATNAGRLRTCGRCRNATIRKPARDARHRRRA